MTRIGILASWLGGGALIFACLANTLAVIGHHVGLPLHGAIELVQAGILVAGSVALVMATANHSHARVRVLIDRLPPAGQAVAGRLAALASFGFFAALLAGGIWVAWDLWPVHEVSEVLGIPWAGLRIFANVAFLLGALLCARNCVAKRQ